MICSNQQNKYNVNISWGSLETPLDMYNRFATFGVILFLMIAKIKIVQDNYTSQIYTGRRSHDSFIRITVSFWLSFYELW